MGAVEREIRGLTQALVRTRLERPVRQSEPYTRFSIPQRENNSVHSNYVYP